MPSAIRRRVADAGARALLVRAALLLALAAPVLSAQQAPNIPPPADVKATGATSERRVGGLRGGDLLRVVVFKEKELSGDYLIDARGFVQIPGIGVLEVAGLEPHEAQARIVEALRGRAFTAPDVSVQAQVRVSVLGEVRQPAMYPTEPGTSLLQLLTLAGGPTERANLRATRVVRDGRVFVVDLESGLAGGAAGRVVLYSGDYVVVPRRTGLTRENFQFVTGLVGTIAALTAAVVSVSNR
jgi:polysaccharide export outer membrane protein